MRVSLLAFTEKGAELAARLAQKLGGTAERCGKHQRLSAWTAEAFQNAQALIFVGAAGIAVRAIAPCLQNKASDPAVLVVDECGHFVIPILSGHLGGANALAREIGTFLGVAPVITTATDGRGLFAVDEWARWQGCAVPNPERIKAVSAKLLAGETALARSEWPIAGQAPAQIVLTEASVCDFELTIHPNSGTTLLLIPRIAVIGVGCKKGTSRDKVEAAFRALLQESRVAREAVLKLCSIDLKKEEPGLLAFCGANGFLFETFSAARLREVQGDFSSSAFVQNVTGVDNVCERSAVLGSGGTLIQKKITRFGVTMAMACAPFAPDWRWQLE